MAQLEPIVFLDIDGVLNALGGETSWGDTFDVWEGPSPAEQFQLFLSKEMAQAVMGLGEVVWVTTWQDHAWRVGQHLGIEADFLKLSRNTAWKRGAVNRFLDKTPRPWLWFEDEPGWAGTHNRIGFNNIPTGFLCNPNPLQGIQPEHIEDAKKWIEEHV